MTTPLVGVLSIMVDAKDCFYVIIKESDGTVAATGRANVAGYYAVPDLPVGNYAVAVIDPEGLYRGKIIHTTVLP